MQQNVCTALMRNDETKTLCRIKPFHVAGNTLATFFSIHSINSKNSSPTTSVVMLQPLTCNP